MLIFRWSITVKIREIRSISRRPPCNLHAGTVASVCQEVTEVCHGLAWDRLPYPLRYGFLTWSINFRSQPGRI